MHLLILLVFVLVAVGLLIWAIDRSPIAQPWKWIVEAIIAVIAALFLLASAGLIHLPA